MSTVSRKIGRAKVSTTVASENYKYLEKKVAAGEARSIADAIDQSIAALRRLDNRRRLAAATSNYFNSLGSEAASEENAIGHGLASAAKEIDFDSEL